jgi:hypothetical protein
MCLNTKNYPLRGRRGAVDIASASGTEDPGSNPAWVHIRHF